MQTRRGATPAGPQARHLRQIAKFEMQPWHHIRRDCEHNGEDAPEEKEEKGEGVEEDRPGLDAIKACQHGPVSQGESHGSHRA